MIEEIDNYLKDFRKEYDYGWYDTKGVLRLHIDKDFIKEYRLQTADEVRNSKYGICWDMAEVTREYLKSKGLTCYTIFVCINNLMIKHPNHTFLVLEYNDKYYWVEGAMIKYVGIHEFNSLEELKKKIEDIFPEIANKNIPPKYIKNIEFFKIEKPNDHINAIQYFVHGVKGKKI